MLRGRWGRPDEVSGPMRRDALVGELAGSPPEDLYRVARAVAAMHAPDRRGRCPWCQPRSRWWRRRRRDAPCQTRRVIAAELRTGSSANPTWTRA